MYWIIKCTAMWEQEKSTTYQLQHTVALPEETTQNIENTNGLQTSQDRQVNFGDVLDGPKCKSDSMFTLC